MYLEAGTYTPNETGHPAEDNCCADKHEAQGNLKNLKLKSGTTDTRGRAKLTVAAGQTLDLGDIKVPAKALVPK